MFNPQVAVPQVGYVRNREFETFLDAAEPEDIADKRQELIEVLESPRFRECTSDTAELMRDRLAILNQRLALI